MHEDIIDYIFDLFLIISRAASDSSFIKEHTFYNKMRRFG